MGFERRRERRRLGGLGHRHRRRFSRRQLDDLSLCGRLPRRQEPSGLACLRCLAPRPSERSVQLRQSRLCRRVVLVQSLLGLGEVRARRLELRTRRRECLCGLGERTLV